MAGWNDTFVESLSNDSRLLALSVVASIVVGYLGVTYIYFKRSVAQRLNVLAKGGSTRFPLGSLGNWDDLLRTNKDILRGFEANGSKTPVAQWTFTSESLAVVRHDHVGAVLRGSVSRAMQPTVLNAMGLYHITRFMGRNSVGVLEGERWSSTRKSIGKSLKTSYIRSLYASIVEVVEDVAVWLESRDLTADLDLAPIMHAITIDVVCHAVFKSKLGAVDAVIQGHPNRLVEAFKLASNEMARRNSSMNPMDWMYFLGPVRPKQKRLNDANGLIRKGVEELVRKRIDAGISDEEDDLLLHLGCTTHDKVNTNVIDNIVTMIWAGHDTTAGALSFCLHLLSVHQDWQDRLREELSANEPLSAEVVAKLPTLDAVMKETLRLHPPAIWTNRGLTKDVELNMDGQVLVLPKGSSVFVPIWAVHRSKENWGDDVNTFNPDRFIKEKPKPFAFVPFGGGKRVCPGQGLAPFEFKTVLSYFIRRFKVSQVAMPDGTLHQPTVDSQGMFEDCIDNRLNLHKV